MFDLGSLSLSVIAGAIGGGLGGLFGALVGQFFRTPKTRSTVAMVFVAAGIANSNPVIVPLLDSQFGAPVRGGEFDSVYEAQVLPALKDFPALQRIFREHPDVEVRFREKAREAYTKGGAKELAEESPAIGATVLASAFGGYLPRARGEDLIAFA